MNANCANCSHTDCKDHKVAVHNREMFRQALHVISNQNKREEAKRIMDNVKPLGFPGIENDLKNDSKMHVFSDSEVEPLGFPGINREKPEIKSHESQDEDDPLKREYLEGEDDPLKRDYTDDEVDMLGPIGGSK